MARGAGLWNVSDAQLNRLGWAVFTVVLVIGLTGLLILDSSPTTGDLAHQFPLWIVLLVLCGVPWALAVVRTIWRTGGHQPVGKRAVWLAIAFVAFLATAMVTAADVPFGLRWRLARGSFDEAVAHTDADRAEGAVPELSDQRIGTFEVSGVYVLDGGVAFSLGSVSGVSDGTMALLYLEGGPGTDYGALESLGDGWYLDQSWCSPPGGCG